MNSLLAEKATAPIVAPVSTNLQKSCIVLVLLARKLADDVYTVFICSVYFLKTLPDFVYSRPPNKMKGLFSFSIVAEGRTSF